MVNITKYLGGITMKQGSSSFKTKEVVGIINAIRRGRIAAERLEEYLCSKRVSPESKYNIQLDLVKFKKYRNRIVDALNHTGLKTLGDLVERSEGEVLHTKNLGQNTLLEIKITLSRYGLFLSVKSGDLFRDK